MFFIQGYLIWKQLPHLDCMSPAEAHVCVWGGCVTVLSLTVWRLFKKIHGLPWKTNLKYIHHHTILIMHNEFDNLCGMEETVY